MKKQWTICSTMFCYNDAEVTNDPAHPPFCDECKEDNRDKEDNGAADAPAESSETSQ